GGLPHENRAGLEEPAGNDGIAVGYPVLMRVGAERRTLAVGGSEVLQRDRHAMQRTEWTAFLDRALGLFGFRQCLLLISKAEGVELRVNRGNPIQTVADGLDGGDLPRPDHPG